MSNTSLLNLKIVFILLLGLLLRLVIAVYLFPGYDEAYYYLYTKHLNWSYFDHPILVAITTGFGPWVTGVVSQFTIRLGPLLVYTGSLYLLYLSGVKLYGKRVGELTLVIASIIPIFTIAFGILTLPDVPLMFFWSATIYCASREFFPKDNTYRPTYRLVIMGLLVGLACLGKYHGFVLGLGILVFCLVVPAYRCVFTSRWAWLGLLSFLITLSPLLIWNIQQDFISFRFQLMGRFGRTPPPYNPLNVLLVALAGIGYLFPTMGFPLWWVIGKTSYHQILHELEVKATFLLCISLPLVLGFTLLGGSRQILATWPMPGFWGLTILLANYACQWEKYYRRGVKLWLTSSATVVTVLLLFSLLHVTTGTLQKPGQYSWFGGLVGVKDDPSTELLDVRQLGEEITKSPVVMKALENSSFIITNEYFLAGYIAMAVDSIKKLDVTCFSRDQRGFLLWDKSPEWLGRDGLYITTRRFATMSKPEINFSSYFRKYQLVSTLYLRRGGEVTEEFYVYQGKNLLKPYEQSSIGHQRSS